MMTVRHLRLFLVLGALIASSSSSGASPLSLDERIAFQGAIEQVYYRHRIWPKENPAPKPPFEELMPPPLLRAKVEDYLKKSNALEVYWKRPVTAEQLQAEMDRMARDTKDAAVLRELFAALDNDPYVIAECLARPSLVDREIHNWYANDSRFHAEVKAGAERDLAEMGPVGRGLVPRHGHYREVEWLKDDGVPQPGHHAEGNAIRLSSDEWKERTTRLPAELRRVSALQEDDERFYVTAVLSREPDRMRVATVEWRKASLNGWWREAQRPLPAYVVEPAEEYRSQSVRVASASCTPDTWTPVQGSPAGRWEHTAVWTGNEMIVWGGDDGSFAVNTGGRYNPSTDSWLPTSTGPNVPTGRWLHTAVWTGSEMIVCGGGDSGGNLNTGGRYNPSTDSWLATSTGANVPAGRRKHTAVWTGKEMIVWGGWGSSFFNTGGRYNPATDSWLATSTGPNAPAGRDGHTAVWTGDEMIVWGGQFGSSYLNTGGRYAPATDSWLATSTGPNVPAGRSTHTAIWTGSEMIVWGGTKGSSLLNTGGRYSPSMDSWVASSTGANVPEARVGHTAVWTGSEMIVWGGYDGGTNLNAGSRYDPAIDSWEATSMGTNVPAGRDFHTAVWTGSEMIVWGGYNSSTYLKTGSRYNPTTDSWVATADAPSARDGHTPVWTGSEMVVWGGNDGISAVDTGGRYNPATDSWLATSTGSNVPTGRWAHTAVWTGSEMIIWGGGGSSFSNTGGRYNPAADSWLPTSTGANVPAGRDGHTALWTGSEMIVWGGYDGNNSINTGGRYDPVADSWVGTSTGANLPASRNSYTAVWTGSEMIVWGGFGGSSHLNTGGRYDPGTDTWVATSVGANVPEARAGHTGVWTGSEMIVWGGWRANVLDTGGRYDPSSDSWIATSTGANLPAARARHTAVWTGSEMIVWGGQDGAAYFNTGGRYDPATDSWAATSTGANAPSVRVLHTAAWTGSAMIVWGGYDGSYDLGTGALYCADAIRRVDYVLGQGLGQANPNEVKVYTGPGVVIIDFFAYAAGQWGVNVAGADIELGDYQGMLTGPGPGPVFGPQVRAFRRNSAPVAKVNLYAYGTLRYGVNVASGSTDGDAYDEIVTGAGPGAVFGPHVRGFNYDNSTLSAIAKINFYAYGTLKYGVNVSSGNVDGDAWDELVTGAGPGPVFASTVRGWNVDGGSVSPIAKINYNAFSYAGYGVNVAGGDVDGDSFDEIAATPGPGPTHQSRFIASEYGTPLFGFDITPYTSLYGGRVGAGDVTNDGREDLLCGAGRDPSADASVKAFDYTGSTLMPLPGTPFDPFPGQAYGVNVATTAAGY